jgi:hypothetical protein
VRANRDEKFDRSDGADVTASEIAAFAYCAKAWHLERVIGVPTSATATRSRDGGTSNHIQHGRNVRVGSWLGRRARWAVAALLIVAALLVGAALGVG